MSEPSYRDLLDAGFAKYLEESSAELNADPGKDLSEAEKGLRALFAIEAAKKVTFSILEAAVETSEDDPNAVLIEFATKRIQSAWGTLKQSVTSQAETPFDKVKIVMEDLSNPFAIEDDLATIDNGAIRDETTRHFKTILEFMGA